MIKKNYLALFAKSFNWAGFFLPRKIYDGLYFVGAGTHPGAGVPGVLSSAKVLDKII